MIRSQRTIKNEVSCRGIGLHSGKQANLTLRPAPLNTGIRFVRTDLAGAEVRATGSNTAATGYATVLRQNRAVVQTVEHLMAALAGLGIDNVVVEIDSEEVPIMDGSAGPFVRLIAGAGIRLQGGIQPVLKVIKPLFVREGSKQLAVWPADTPSVSYFIDFSHPLLREQSFSYRMSGENFIREVADARTFGFLRDEPVLRSNGLAKGASLDNAVVLSDDAVLNKEGLRYPDEFVRHKILDLIGDMSLVGMPVVGHVVAHKSGHSLNARMVAKLLESSLHWVLLGAEEPAPARQKAAYRQAAVL